ncbi:hypothetical protein C2845_PM03G31620 [Panicum miliaceum]|uniref:F-box domain-containing protein n=1 Tax=Panicum miliaceum TaxID=4540 RepID=A0A3L6T8J4_PANMI|nr:hypothetical protein C2845_PM03G31620 [Panicum miliaceum]
MEKETLRQRTPATKLPTTVNDVPDHILKLIFRRLDSHVSFLRAAAVCTRWRRIASTRGTKYRDWNHHHFFTILGHYHVVDPSFSPSPAQRRRRRVVFVPASPSIDARHFTLDFLPSGRGGRPWELVDGCGSLLLVTANQQRGCFPDLVVCEPSSRRYIRIKPAEDMRYSHCLGVFFDGRYSVMSMSSFSLTCVVSERAAGIAGGVSFVTARVYTHKPPWCRRWRHGWSTSRHAMPGGIHIRGAESAHYAGRSKGYIFWAIEDDGSVFAAREGTGALSHFRLPENRGSCHRSTFRFIDDDGADNLVRVVSLIGDDLRVFVQKEHNNGGSDWVLVRSLHLPEATLELQGYKECFFSRTAKIVAAGKGYVVLTQAEETWLFSIELGTMQVEREHIRNRLAGEVYPYELRLQPKVRVCVSYCKRGRDGPCYDFCKCK